jgi:hypothetical protein
VAQANQNEGVKTDAPDFFQKVAIIRINSRSRRRFCLGRPQEAGGVSCEFIHLIRVSGETGVKL